MKIAFLTTRVEKPSTRYRFLQYISYLEKEGFSIKVFTIQGGFFNRINLFESLDSFDIVFLQKKLFSFFDWHSLRKNARKLIYDFDDAVMFNDSKKKDMDSSRRLKRFKRTVGEADLVIAGNNYLKEWALKFNKNTLMIPTPIDMKRYKEKSFEKMNGDVVIGWIGSETTLYFLEKMRDILDKVNMEFPHTKLKIVCNAFFDCNHIAVEKKEWKYDEEIRDLHSFDIGLMPLTDDVWTRGKCGFKLLQYMAVGLPAVASPVGVNSEIINHGINGFLAKNKDDWRKNISTLIKDVDLRKRIGKEARNTVIERYSLEVNAPKLKDALKM